MKKNISKVEQVSWHRNGIGGAGFHAVLFRWEGDGPPTEGNKKMEELFGKTNDTVKAGDLMLGIVFDEPHHVAVLAVDPLSNKPGVEFGANSWRGDRFEQELRDAIKNNESAGSTRVGPFGIPTEKKED